MGWESGHIIRWVVHVGQILMTMPALVSVHVGNLGFELPMPHVPAKSVLPGHMLAARHVWPAVYVLQMTQSLGLLHVRREMLHHWVSWHGASQHMRGSWQGGGTCAMHGRR